MHKHVYTFPRWCMVQPNKHSISCKIHQFTWLCNMHAINISFLCMQQRSLHTKEMLPWSLTNVHESIVLHSTPSYMAKVKSGSCLASTFIHTLLYTCILYVYIIYTCTCTYKHINTCVCTYTHIYSSTSPLLGEQMVYLNSRDGVGRLITYIHNVQVWNIRGHSIATAAI